MTTKQSISVYIHRAHSICSNQDIFRDTFNNVLGADCVGSVDVIKKTDQKGVPFIRAFVHFKFWPRGEIADNMYNELMMDKRLEIIYNGDTKWFWIFCRSKLPPRNPPVKNKHTSEKKMLITNTNDLLPNKVVTKRNQTNIAYNETSKRTVSNIPAWMTTTINEGGDRLYVADSKSISDDGELDENEWNSDR